MKKQSRANVTPKRQRTQYSCMATSMSMCLQALGYDHASEDEVNKVMGALPMQGASWEQALACAQHYGCRATLTTPSTIAQLKSWTDRGIPVMIAYNPEGRDWSHASVVFDVTEANQVLIADPNIPNPEETVRILSAHEFYSKWYEKWPNYLVRRPACAIEREITPEGKQIMASNQKENKMSRKITAKELLREVREIKKLAGSPMEMGEAIENALTKLKIPNGVDFNDEGGGDFYVETPKGSFEAQVTDRGWNLHGSGIDLEFWASPIYFDEEGYAWTNDFNSVLLGLQTLMDRFDYAAEANLQQERQESLDSINYAIRRLKWVYEREVWSMEKDGKEFQIKLEDGYFANDVMRRGNGNLTFSYKGEGYITVSLGGFDITNHTFRNLTFTPSGIPIYDIKEFKTLMSKIKRNLDKWW